MNPRNLLRGLVLIAVLVGLAYVAELTGLRATLDESWIEETIRGEGHRGELIFVGLGALVTCVGVPRHVDAFAGGYAFGLAAGTALALAAEMLGCVLSFYYARLAGGNVLSAWSATRKIDRFVAGNPFRMTLLVRLLPVGNNLAVNLGAGLSSVRGLPFFAGSALGYLPQTAIFALLGSGMHIDPVLRVGLAVVLFVASGLIGIQLYRRCRRDETLEDIEEQLG